MTDKMNPMQLMQMIQSACDNIKDEATRSAIAMVLGVVSRMFADMHGLGNNFMGLHEAGTNTAITTESVLRLCIDKGLFSKEEVVEVAKGLYEEFTKQAEEEVKQPESDTDEETSQ